MKLLLTMVALALVASPSLAYVQAGHLQGGVAKVAPAPASAYQTVAKGASGPGLGISDPGLGINEPASPDGEPTRPVPEPGMMALASMGLLALGVAGRRRLGR